MKTIITFLTMLALCNAQEFTYTADGLTDFVVVEMEGKTQSELYNTAKDWIEYNYENPDEVLKSDVKNKMLRFQGIKPNGVCQKILLSTMCDDILYTIQLDFKDGKMKVDPLELEWRSTPTLANPNPLRVDFNDTKRYYTKKGKLRSMYKSFPEAVETTLNGLVNSLKGVNVEPKEDW